MSQLDNLKKQRVSPVVIKVGLSSCGIAAGAKQVFQRLQEEIAARGLEVDLMQCGCAGMCYAEPLVEVRSRGWIQSYMGECSRRRLRRYWNIMW